MAFLLAYRNTVHDFSKTVLSITGIVAAIVLVFMQLGFRGAVITTSTAVYQGLDFDLILQSREYLQLVDAGQIDRSWISVLKSMPEVESAIGLDIGVGQWRRSSDGTSRAMMVLGVTQGQDPFFPKPSSPDLSALKLASSILIDSATHKAFLPKNGIRFGTKDVGSMAEISQHKFKIQDTFQLGTGLAVNGSGVVTQQAFGKLFPHHSAQKTSLILVKLHAKTLEEKKRKAKQLMDRLKSHGSLPFDGKNRQEVYSTETSRWLYQTPIGLIFTLGVLVSTVIGAVIVYMVLVSDVRKKLPEYATLGAIGYSGKFLAAVVLYQAILLSLFAFLPSLGIAQGLYWLTSQMASVPLEMNWQKVVFVLGLTVVMSSVSGLLAVTKLWKAEPASLF